MGEAFKRFGLFVTEEQAKELLDLYKQSEGPLMGVSYRHTREVAKRMDEAREEYHTKLDALAVAAGLPEPAQDPENGVCHYGIDFRNREILGVVDGPENRS